MRQRALSQSDDSPGTVAHRPRAKSSAARVLPKAVPVAVAALTGLCWIACQAPAPEHPALREPIISFEGDALRGFLSTLRTLEDTPLGLTSARILERIETCQQVFAHLPKQSAANDSTQIAGAFACQKDLSDDDLSLAQFAANRRAENDGLLLWPIGQEGRVELQFEIDASNGLAIAGRILPGDEMGAMALLIPSDTSPAPAVIRAPEPLAHLRMRSRDGLHLSEWIESGGQADRLFALKGRLLEGALLEDTWEVALLPPTQTGIRPLAVAAIHHRQEASIRLAINEVLSQLESTWPIERTTRTFKSASGESIQGECYLDLPLLPELAPCWVVNERALILGDQPAAIEQALAGAPEPITPEASSLHVDFDRMGLADQQLIPEARRAQLSDLWTQMHLETRSTENRGNTEISIDAKFEARS